MPEYISLDVIYNSGGGLQFGCMYVYGNSSATSIAVMNTWYQYTYFDTNGESNGSVTPDHTNDHITVGEAGRYFVIVTIVFDNASTVEGYTWQIFKNNGAAGFGHLGQYTFGEQRDNLTIAGIANFAANDTIELWVRNSGGTTNIEGEDITMSVVQIGGAP